MIQQSGIWAEAHTVGHFDSFPELGDRVGRIDPEHVAGDRLVAAERVELERTDENAALRGNRKIVEPAQRAAFPLSEQVAALPRRLAPANQAATAADDSAGRVERDSADAAPARDESFDAAVRAPPVDAAIRHVTEVEPVALVDARPLDETVAVSQGFKLHRGILPLPV